MSSDGQVDKGKNLPVGNGGEKEGGGVSRTKRMEKICPNGVDVGEDAVELTVHVKSILIVPSPTLAQS